MKILITGGAGYLGSVMTGKFLREGHEVTVYDNLLYKQDSLFYYCHNDRFNFVYGDVRDKHKLRPLVDHADVIIPLAAIVGAPACNRDKNLAADVNFKHVSNICDWAGDKQRILYPNTNSGYGTGKGTSNCTEEDKLVPISHYGQTKCDAEKCVLDKGGISFRLATVFGISTRMRLDLLVNDFTYKALTDGYIVLFEKHFKRNYIHVRDVARAFYYMALHYYGNSGNVFNLGLSDANLSKWELANKIKEYVPGFSIQCDDIREDPDKRDYIISNEKIERAGWKAKYSLDYGIQELIKGFPMLFHSQQVYSNV
jgi:nucleoside-diphosphate-sugar epimerase